MSYPLPMNEDQAYIFRQLHLEEGLTDSIGISCARLEQRLSLSHDIVFSTLKKLEAKGWVVLKGLYAESTSSGRLTYLESERRKSAIRHFRSEYFRYERPDDVGARVH